MCCILICRDVVDHMPSNVETYFIHTFDCSPHYAIDMAHLFWLSDSVCSGGGGGVEGARTQVELGGRRCETAGCFVMRENVPVVRRLSCHCGKPSLV